MSLASTTLMYSSFELICVRIYCIWLYFIHKWYTNISIIKNRLLSTIKIQNNCVHKQNTKISMSFLLVEPINLSFIPFRDGNLIPYDTDMDISILSSEIQRIKSLSVDRKHLVEGVVSLFRELS